MSAERGFPKETTEQPEGVDKTAEEDSTKEAPKEEPKYGGVFDDRTPR